MAILIFFVLHWYISLFFQSFFMHRYAAHGHFTMSRGWERFFYICSFLSQGSSYISPTTYGLMHRIHHAHTDKALDPHSPHNEPNIFLLLWDTRNYYFNLWIGKMQADEKYHKDLPRWETFDRFTHNYKMRLLWVAIYFAFYFFFATSWWLWLLFPLTIIMGSLHGIAVNWWAHKFGYENFSLNNTSKNILPVDLLFVGEAYHNNHHKHPGRPNNAVRWFEWDLTYNITKLLDRAGIVRIKPAVVTFR
ncbi:fatty acid desaturase [Pedobacter sp. SYP-B3415]|uniref:fatty acid desaturase n=1 Tax=Pedobacter sp. SYP-B3415 TaxID=2496641 RepID=UPI00101D9B71|nr:fatty acid desaturase [Pedobacter sp. SYP-B3415]